MAFPYLNGGCKKEGKRLFSRVCCDRTSGNDFKLKEQNFSLDVRKKKRFFTITRVVKALQQVAQRGGGYPDTQGQAGRGSEHPDITVDCIAGGWNGWTLGVPSNSNDSVVL